MNLNLLFLIIASIYLSGAAYFDYKNKKVPNKYNKFSFFTSLVLVLATLFFEFDYFLNSLAGLVLGFLILFIPFVFRVGGAGDVKILSILGLLVGWKSLLAIVFVSFVYKAGIFIPLTSGLSIIPSLLAPISAKNKLVNSFYLLKNKYTAYAPFLFLACLSYLIVYLFYPSLLKFQVF